MKKRLMQGVAMMLGLLWLSPSVAQSDTTVIELDSTTLTLTMSDAILETEDDSLLFPTGYFGNLELSFTLPDTGNVYRVYIELSVQDSRHIIYRRDFSVEELQSAGLLVGTLATINFGNLESEQSYTTSIIIEDADGTFGEGTKKTISP